MPGPKTGPKAGANRRNYLADVITTPPTSILFRRGQVYRAFETCPVGDDAVGRSQWESLVVAGDLSRDLLDPSAWRMSNKVHFPGVPDVLSQRKYRASAADKVVEDCFIEGNIIDVRGEMRVLLRTIIDGHTTGGIASVCSLEDDGERLDYRFRAVLSDAGRAVQISHSA